MRCSQAFQKLEKRKESSENRKDHSLVSKGLSGGKERWRGRRGQITKTFLHLNFGLSNKGKTVKG